MFSDVIHRLRLEAEKTTATHAELLAEYKAEMSVRDAVQPGMQAELWKAGVVTLLTGMAGVAATAMAYHDAMLGSAAQIEQAILGLGSMVADGMQVPVAGLIAFGAGVVGATSIVVADAMGALEERGMVTDEALREAEYNAFVDGNGRCGELGVVNWATAAMKVAGDLVRGRVALVIGLENRVHGGEGLATEGWYSGRVVDVTGGVVTQKIGRGEADVVRHDAGKLTAVLREGDVVDVRYDKEGLGVVSGLEKGLGAGVER